MAFNEKKAERVIRFIECLKHTKGSFNIRISPELHRRAAIYATTHQTTLNHVVENALEHYVPAY